MKSLKKSVIQIETPFTKEKLKNLKAGDLIELSGIIFTARDLAHKKLVDLLDSKKSLPLNLMNTIIYFVGPSPAKPGHVIGSAGPTTSTRMDKYSPRLMQEGLTGMIGKGNRSQEVVDAMIKYHAVYFAATGGAAALISKSIKKADLVAYPELGPEAIYRLEIEKLPLVVAIDSKGNNLYIKK